MLFRATVVALLLAATAGTFCSGARVSPALEKAPAAVA